MESTTNNHEHRSSILGSFLRGRPRNSSQSHPQPPTLEAPREISPPPSPLHNSLTTSGLTHMLRRRRSNNNIGALPPLTTSPGTPPTASALPSPSMMASPSSPILSPVPTAPSTAPTHRLRLVPHLESRRTLKFDPIGRDVAENDTPLRIGRFTDRAGQGLATVNAQGSGKIAFKSKVVSRSHAELWVEGGGQFFIKDTKSSSGTFLNHSRLSPAGQESRKFQIRDGDLLQLGVDYQGGAEDVYKSVKIRVEIGRGWQASANAFNTNALKNLKTLTVATAPSGAPSAKSAVGKHTIPDCCICLFAVTIRQALFLAPCSHTFHFKCIRPMLESHHPAFSCPLCRTYADLDEDVEVELDLEVPASEAEDDSAAENQAILAGSLTALSPRPLDRGAETEVENDAAPSRIARPDSVLSESPAEDMEVLDIVVQGNMDDSAGAISEGRFDDFSSAEGALAGAVGDGDVIMAGTAEPAGKRKR